MGSTLFDKEIIWGGELYYWVLGLMSLFLEGTTGLYISMAIITGEMIWRGIEVLTM